ncbi:MAG: DUF2891 domain-containing protein [Candidatus Latescibacterota bacterium]|nr:MAG: DUF2891 domain-containing protein [Candidatus Latescibacterota bacterium]
MKKNQRITVFLIVSLVASFPAFVAETARENKNKSTPEVSLMIDIKLTPQTASSFSRLALECIKREYPNKPSHVMNNKEEVQNPKSLHPVFFGCFDWHSAVHGHWMLVRLLRLFPELSEASEIRAALNDNLTAENVEREVAYLDQPNRKSFERTYGWAWLLKLAEELHRWNDPDAKRWSANLEPLTRAIVDRYIDFLPRQTYPIRTGVHPNTAFGIAFALDYARTVGDTELEHLLVARSLTYFENDTDYPAKWEPGGDDFFSPCLMEADLMRRVLEPPAFAKWFEEFLPSLERSEPRSLIEPATVADRTDPKIVHLDGLNLSRAWCMVGIASALPKDAASTNVLLQAAGRHAEDALAHVARGHYEGEHWLASFAVYMLSTTGQPE